MMLKKTSIIIITLLCIALTAMHFYLGLTTNRVIAVSGGFKLPVKGVSPLQVPPGVTSEEIRQAVLAAPLEQTLLNAAMVEQVATHPGSDLTPWVKLLRRSGWRDLITQQNLIAEAISREDINALLDSADALLRQLRLSEDAFALVAMSETNPATWGHVYVLLATNVPWRYIYLSRVNLLRTNEMLDARGRTLSQLLVSKKGVHPNEMRSFIGALVKAGRIRDADVLWSRFDRANAHSLIQDTTFSAVRRIEADDTIVPSPFEWTLNNGAGFSTGLTDDGLGGSYLTIDWDGHGLPVFLLQRTRAKVGKYHLQLMIDGDPKEFANRIGARLYCDEVTKVSVSLAQKTNTSVVFGNIVAMCDYPTIELFGNVQNVTRAFQGSIKRIDLMSFDNSSD